MAAHLLAPLLAFLLSAAGGAAPPGLATAAKGEAIVAGVYADLSTICAASDPLIDALEDANPHSATLARLASVADAVCAAAKKPNNPIDQVELVVVAIEALSRAGRMATAPAQATSAAGPAAPAPRLRGRSP